MEILWWFLRLYFGVKNNLSQIKACDASALLGIIKSNPKKLYYTTIIESYYRTQVSFSFQTLIMKYILRTKKNWWGKKEGRPAASSKYLKIFLPMPLSTIQSSALPTTHAWWQGAARHFSTHWTSKTFLMTWKCQRHVVLLHILCLWAFLSPDYKNSTILYVVTL